MRQLLFHCQKLQGCEPHGYTPLLKQASAVSDGDGVPRSDAGGAAFLHG